MLTPLSKLADTVRQKAELGSSPAEEGRRRSREKDIVIYRLASKIARVFTLVSRRVAFLASWFALGISQRSEGYVFIGYHWPDGTQIAMHLGLDRAPVAFQDGSASWNGSAADALNIWNQYLGRVRFAAADEVTGADGDGVNSVFFSTTIYGESFGSNVLAVTTHHSSGSVFTETDVIFNNATHWDSYRGPLQGSGPNGLYDFHRVALHEFGHALGLDHPDENGQTVTAIMNSITSDLDQLADDDIAGVIALYHLYLTNTQRSKVLTSGQSFSYQVTAANNPTRYEATGLPDGLQIDPQTGLISGICRGSGQFIITITVYGDLGPAQGTLQLNVKALPLTSAVNVDATIGDLFTYQITAMNNPSSFVVTGLPPELSLDPATGIISGYPTTLETIVLGVKAIGATSEASAEVHIYAAFPAITSSGPATGSLGGTFSYQIVATNHPFGFSATDLPAGLSLDPTTGLITGTIELSGTYSIMVTAQGTLGTVSGSFTLTVAPIPPDMATVPAAQISLANTGPILADPERNRLYLYTRGQVLVVDGASLAVSSIPIGNVIDISDWSISTDKKKLWIAPIPKDGSIASVDLESSVALPELVLQPYTIAPQDVREGANGRLYLTTAFQSGVLEIDPVTGKTLSQLLLVENRPYPLTRIEVSPDHRVLYISDEDSNGIPLVANYDVSSQAAPTALQQVQVADAGDSPINLATSPNQPQVLVSTTVRSTADLSKIITDLDVQQFYQQAEFSPDGLSVVMTSRTEKVIDIYDAQTGILQRTITLPQAASSVWHTAVLGTNIYATDGITLNVYPITAPAPVVIPPHTLLNVATRLRAGTGDNVLIGGFIISGSEAKTVLLRGIGPSLPVSDKLLDPVLELRGSDGSLVEGNDNWNAHRETILATQLPPLDEHEAAIATTLAPGAYTAILSGVGNTTGIGLVEIYDLSGNAAARLANISTRGFVESGDNVMIGSFIIGGTEPTKVMVRAIGPSLGVPGSLDDTMLELHDGNGTQIAFNDDWQSDQAQEIIGSTIPPGDPRESAIVATLAPGNYTAIVRGKDNTTGVALVEAYNLETN